MVNFFDNLLRVIPFSTLSIAGVLIAVRYDLWLQIVEETATYLNVSTERAVWIGIGVIFGVMIGGFLIWKFIEYLQNYWQAQREAQEVYNRERAALLSLFNSLNGKNWLDKTRWGSDEPLYRWKGVKLDPITHRVNKLILPDNNLTGFIHEDIGNLEGLIEIDFRRNSIRGTLPKSLLGLKKLEGIYLYDNFIEGEIPKELADLPHLLGVYLFNNSFKNSQASSDYFKSKLPEEKCYVFI
mmetsp:Transcript_21251/g.23081  ORF Transcript_21251/g.23081 Transcript_21251/m.23081 type:complete len:240 (-) Transcript_21251:104-823(-)|eukprot:gene1100-1167_t